MGAATLARMSDARQTRSLTAQEALDGASIDPEVAALRPDYRVLLLVVDGIRPAASDGRSEALLTRAEQLAASAADAGPVEELPHAAAWRAAYRAFGAKPQRTRHSLEALTRRAPRGLPRVNLLTDVYNAISVLHQVPIGGEDLDGYAGPPRLVRASGDEAFDTVAGGEVVVEHPEVGEVVWTDPAGVTCRRWNWRQCRRTALTEGTTRALFIVDALEPMTDDELTAVGDALEEELRRLGPDVEVRRRVLRAAEARTGEGDASPGPAR